MTGSTNADLVAAVAAGSPDRSVLVADVQTAGRGRLGRRWQAPTGTALMFSVLLRPGSVPVSRWGWVGALLGLAVVAALDERVPGAGLKWPNDVLLGSRKVAGVLAEMTGGALVVGAGINVSLTERDLPRPDATSLVLAGADRDGLRREVLLAQVLDAFAPLLDRWQRTAGDIERSGLRQRYLARCTTVGARVEVQLPDGTRVVGVATDVAADGSVVVDDGVVVRRFAAGDVQHLRVGRSTATEGRARGDDG